MKLIITGIFDRVVSRTWVPSKSKPQKDRKCICEQWSSPKSLRSSSIRFEDPPISFRRNTQIIIASSLDLIFQKNCRKYVHLLYTVYTVESVNFYVQEINTYCRVHHWIVLSQLMTRMMIVAIFNCRSIFFHFTIRVRFNSHQPTIAADDLELVVAESIHHIYKWYVFRCREDRYRHHEHIKMSASSANRKHKNPIPMHNEKDFVNEVDMK